MVSCYTFPTAEMLNTRICKKCGDYFTYVYLPVCKKCEKKFMEQKRGRNKIKKLKRIGYLSEFSDAEASGSLQSVFDACLTPREEKVIRMRFNIGEKKKYTLEAIGSEFGVSKERIRQIETKALRRVNWRLSRI